MWAAAPSAAALWTAELRPPASAVRHHEREEQGAEDGRGEEEPRLHGTVLSDRLTEQPPGATRV